MKKITFIFASALLILSIFSQVPFASEKSDFGKEKYLYLIVGFDDTAENTDVMFTLGIDLKENTAYVAQIPRDTYYNFGGAQNKINQIYAMERILGESKFSALKKTTDAVSEAFGASIDGFIGITTNVFREVVDAIGGVDITLAGDLVVKIDGEEPIVLRTGDNHINGDVAEKFVRYRKGYATGDLGRIDAQKLFINAVFAKISSGVPISTLASIAYRVKDNLVTNLSIADILPTVLKSKKSEEEKKTFFVTVPGAAAFSDTGVSYYVINKSSAYTVAQKYMFSNMEFDTKRKFLNPSWSEFLSIYEADNIKVNEFSNKSLNDVALCKPDLKMRFYKKRI